MQSKAPIQIVKAFIYVYAAVYMALWKITSLILPYPNIEMINLFLQEVSQDFKDFFVIIRSTKPDGTNPRSSSFRKT